ncbi:uncharacterized protein LOC114858799 [Betta splendens]|uniref:Uncharacterized protein LOC114858799 n=1 Tax=Betta splendens TaxID=158456 RepID=A0A9W2XW03_BETSP|nr:uncharacterized protein LOC114858799 [Betta splendens]XP_055366176.1 uncharacterized protein LOC114858799 [Betta splendens]
MLEAYFEHVRPHFVKQDVDDKGRFFLSKTGKTLCSATNDMARFYEHFKLPNITSQELRRVIVTTVSSMFSEEQKDKFAHYMAHTTAVAKAHYRMKTAEETVATANVLASLTAYSSSDESNEKPSKKKRGASIDEDTLQDVRKDFAEFLEVFPVTLNGKPPSKLARINAGFPVDRTFYDKWRIAQFQNREDHLLSKCYRRQPTAAKIKKLIESEGWTANYPSPETIVQKWRPPKKIDVETDDNIRRCIELQKWSGVAIKTFEDNRGQGVVATKNFLKGSIICDYHGELITSEEGHQILKSSNDHMGYLFFFTAGSRRLCIDAQTHPCKCHPKHGNSWKKN